MSESPKPTPMPSAEQAGAIDAFTAWRQSKQFVVGGPLLSRKVLKASARELRQRIAPESAWGCLVRRVSWRGLVAWVLRKVKPAKPQRRFVFDGKEYVLLSDEMQPLCSEDLKRLRCQILRVGEQ